MIHELKILPEYFDDVIEGYKNFELRKYDRKYSVNDIILLKEWNGTEYTGRVVKRYVKYILRNCPQYGLKKGYCILGF